MSNPPQPKSPSFRLSRQGFQPLDNGNMKGDDIPLQTVVSHTPSHTPTIKDEKRGMFHRGKRRVQKVDSKGNYDGEGVPPADDDDNSTALNRMGRFYLKILNFSIVTRYIIYVTPVALVLAIPIILSAVGIIKGKIGSSSGKDNGADPRLFFIWIEIMWLSFWTCKVIAHFLPRVFEFLVGVVSPGVKKYVQLLAALERPLSFVFWMISNQVTFNALVSDPIKVEDPAWVPKMASVLLALLVCTCIILGERLLIQLISISYHRKQFDGKIKESKRNIQLLGVMYEASRALFPAYCNEFAEEDYIIQDQLGFVLGSKKNTMGRDRGRPVSKVPMRLMQNVGRVGDKVTSVFGAVAQEMTGKKVFDPNSAHSIVLEALENNRSAEALARRIWLSFVVEGKDALYEEDLIEVMGSGRQKDAEECFASLDRDGNGDISLEEMILTVTDYGRERKSISSSMHDVDQAINALDGLLMVFVFVLCVIVIICFISPTFQTTLTGYTASLLSLSFVFAATCQEILGSCIFLFVKHPFDIGDRVDIATDQLTVEHISLLYTVFKRVNNGKTVQTPNIVLNNLWVENITRSKAMREQVPIFAAFDTSFEDINALKQEMINFVREPANTRDFFPDVEIEVVGIAEMNKLELRVEIRHKSNWSNESLRAARRSKFMCALVVALRKVPIAPPGGNDVGLGDANKPSWSVAISPEEATAVRKKYLDDKEAGKLLSKKDDPEDTGRSSGTDYLGLGNESKAINSLNNRKLGVDTVRDDTWTHRGDDAATIGRPSMDGQTRPETDELRGLLHKATSSGRRKQGGTLSPYGARPSMDSQRSPNPNNPYAPPPGQSGLRSPASVTSASTGYAEEMQYQSMMPQTTTIPPGPNRANQQPQAPGSSTNPYRAASPEMRQYQYKP